MFLVLIAMAFIAVPILCYGAITVKLMLALLYFCIYLLLIGSFALEKYNTTGDAGELGGLEWQLATVYLSAWALLAVLGVVCSAVLLLYPAYVSSVTLILLALIAISSTAMAVFVLSI